MAMKMTATRQKWLDWVEGWEKSGLTPEEFAASEGEPVTAYRLRRWKWKLKQLKGESGRSVPTGLSFVRLEPAVAQSREAGLLEVVSSNGRVVRVPVGFDECTLSRLLVVVDGGAR